MELGNKNPIKTILVIAIIGFTAVNFGISFIRYFPNYQLIGNTNQEKLDYFVPKIMPVVNFIASHAENGTNLLIYNLYFYTYCKSLLYPNYYFYFTQYTNDSTRYTFLINNNINYIMITGESCDFSNSTFSNTEFTFTTISMNQTYFLLKVIETSL